MDFFGRLLDSIEYLWPFRIVEQWETGGYYICGRFWKTVEPGCYPIVPFFMAVIPTTTVPYMTVTPRLDLTLLDGTSVSIVASAWARVTDYNLAVNTVESHEHTTAELLQSVLADRIAQVDASRLEPEKRGRLLSDLTRWAAEEAATFGVEISRVRFSTFVLRAKTYRLLQDNPQM